MITISNFKECIGVLGFKSVDIYNNVYSKYFKDFECYLKVDFKKKELIYPTEKGFKVSGEFTCNFESNENFVVFECVNRLFEKGYKPQHIELEPKWKVGHGASGGRADILIKNHTGDTLLIIECKTEGTEFNREWKNTKNNGGQLFTYAKQSGSTQYVCLYASDFINGKIPPPTYNVISLKDNEKLLEDLKDKHPLTFKDSKSLEVEDLYKAWKDTYNLDFASKGIFEDDIQPYQIGKLKYTTNDLLEISNKDIQHKYNEFATILRQHNVSGRENAFDKLVNLFLCKIVDESKNPTDLKFYWKGIANDSYFDIQDRLQLLYQAGMKEFLGEDVTYIDNKKIDDAFRYVKREPDSTKATIKDYFRQLKFFTNNDFAFIDVHNEKLFKHNSDVLLDIIKIFQDYRLKTDNQNQFLGDMFEGFLDQGVKQSEGQFFTPMPIVKFILNSLPLENIISKSKHIPKVIDYACGAGHFLNEYAAQIKPLIKNNTTNIKEYFKQIHGIEKEYRLSKVAKVSAFMYGQDDIEITYADALGNKADIKNGDYSILISNPPYSVKGFLETLSEEERNVFSLISTIDPKTLSSNNSIETFFIERAKQLIMPGGVAAIILPSSILSNDSSIYTNAREILIKYFHIIAIAEFGSQTFGKTGTNTVTLFLKRREENPAPADHWKNRVNSWFGLNEADSVYKDGHLINNYCSLIEIDVNNYKTLLKGNPNDELLKNEIFTEYKKAFDKQSEIKNLLKQKTFNQKSKAEQKVELYKRFIEYIQTIEKDKLYFFVLASENKHKVLVVKSPSDNKEQKLFLGYEWSSAKGNEGIKYVNQSNIASDIDDVETNEFIQKSHGLHNISTPLYNPNKRDDNSKINHYIKENFLRNVLTINENLSSILSYHNFTDLLDFSRANFNKQISLISKKALDISSKWELVRIEDLVDVIESGSRPEGGVGNINSGAWSLGGEHIHSKNGKVDLSVPKYVPLTFFSQANKGKLRRNDLLICKDGALTGKVALLRDELEGQNAMINEHLFLIRCSDMIKQVYLFNFLYSDIGQSLLRINITGAAQGGLNSTNLKNIRIPLPKKDIQKQIVHECNDVDKLVEKAISEIKIADVEINNLFLSSDYDTNKLNEVIEKQSEIIDPTKEKGDVNYIGLENIESNSGNIVGETFAKYSAIRSIKNVYRKGDLLYGKLRPNLNKVYFANEDGICSTDILVLRCRDEYLSKFYAYYLRTKKFNDKVLRTVSGQQLPRTKWSLIETIKVPVPKPKDKIKIIKQIESLEQKTSDWQAVISSAPQKKKDILKKYL